MALDYKKMAAEIVEKSGGVENIKTVAHCATRLRFTLVNKDIVDMEGIQKIEGVLGMYLRDRSASDHPRQGSPAGL